PPIAYLMVDGQGDPNTSAAYREAVQALYSVAYTLKFMLKGGPEAYDFTVMPLEGLWSADDWDAFVSGDRAAWEWTAMIAQPPPVTPALVEQAVADARRKKGPMPGLERLRLETLHEGLSAQVLHVGPYSAEAPTIERLHGWIQDNGYVLRGRHHEIYLSNPERSAPERLKTIIRQPVAERQ
ncbi:MAG: GyrI-like domain-containing protein, partial [Anaerolineae bacterium]